MCAKQGFLHVSDSSSSAVKSMNRAYMAVQEQSAVDVINSTILLLKLESAGFSKTKCKVWHGVNLSPLAVRNYVMIPIPASTFGSMRYMSPIETLFWNIM